MGLLTAGQREFAQAVQRIIYCNPFLPERIEHERAALVWRGLAEASQAGVGGRSAGVSRLGARGFVLGPRG